MKPLIWAQAVADLAVTEFARRSPRLGCRGALSMRSIGARRGGLQVSGPASSDPDVQ